MPFHRTTAPGTKPPPRTVSEKLEPPAKAEPGDTVKVQVNRAGQTLELPVALTVSN